MSYFWYSHWQAVQGVIKTLLRIYLQVPFVRIFFFWMVSRTVVNESELHLSNFKSYLFDIYQIYTLHMHFISFIKAIVWMQIEFHFHLSQ